MTKRYYLAKNRKQHSPEFYSEDLIGVAGNADRGERKGSGSSRQPDGCGLSWSAITVIKTGNVIVFQVVIWPVQLNPVNVNPPLKEANFPAMS